MRTILVKEVRQPVPTINRLPTRYQREHKDKDRVQLWVGVLLMLGPVVVLIGEVLL